MSLINPVLTAGIRLRRFLFAINPPGNAYDNHLDAIHVYAKNKKIPKPFDCWQCYQPPVYYATGAVIYSASRFLGLSVFSSWKAVQLLNTLLSILSLVLIYAILKKIRAPGYQQALFLSFWAFLPRDLFTSAMISNDYLLVFAAVCAVYTLLKISKHLDNGGKIPTRPMLLLCACVVLGAWSKQHGLLLLCLPFGLAAYSLLWFKRKVPALVYGILALTLALSLSDELWKYQKTGTLLVSNQHHFRDADNQFPGSVDSTYFFSLKVAELYRHPFMSDHTSASFPTEIFARTIFDYEWRFLSPVVENSGFIARIGYTLGLIWLVFFPIVLLSWLYRNKDQLATLLKGRELYLIFLLLALLYALVPLIQTLRFPHYSSMKAMFLLPGLPPLILGLALILSPTKIPKWLCRSMIGLNFGYACLLVLFIAIHIPESINRLSGPLWPLLE